ncbi:MAG: FAD-binding oxidoreductase [Mesorhizobium sp.]|uniref:NAD(P)/FAD-dependent oxidoreductase n=1 Tax=unclassified Mesorhizobium TaxID=325217 RepID=UPI000FD4423F|nr:MULTISPECIES: FAD-binding oxidoreductase [unclassified Mesorhizobium]RVD42239.1 FAD-binding oxidoreductase [Mesorhizobium sp. M4A.F.Ca.ET.020.02.1.1]RWC18398.1 MAG: FAD-binding oxidoreductase [Mesorhizobium sp.]RWC27373.1 MAG: FAD-binding oxidoreductase [Mesorhizobium sp.]RWC55868.1 MAG: FAD-binding oxidoreductase [Mesorhizobium sp.]RWD42240.1 MAG: FAD-binding oxidoreductase [Mesorhizobium sp.]
MMASKTYRARRLPAHGVESGWEALLPARTPAPDLDRGITVDVAIIGAGFAGLAAAVRLANLDPKLSVAIIDADQVGRGASGRNSGFLIDLPHDISSGNFGADAVAKSHNEILIARTAIQHYARLAEEHGWDEDVFDPSGKYSLAMTDAGTEHLEAYSLQLKSLGEPNQLLSASEVEDVTGTRSYKSGLFTPGAVMVQPTALVRAIADVFQEPLRLYERTPALAIESSSIGCTVKTPKGEIRAGRVILATNGHAESFGFGKGELLHVFTHASLTEPFMPTALGGLRKWGATPAAPMGTTVRRINGLDGDRILIRSRYTYHPTIEAGAATIKSASDLHDRKFADRFPDQRHLKMQYRWAGAMALTRNSVPLFGQVADGIFAACACNGIGGTKSTSAGIATAELLVGHRSKLGDIFRSFEKPQTLPPRPFTDVGARLNLAFREWRAGRE